MPNFRLSRARISHERIDQMSFNLFLSVLSNVQIIIKKKRGNIVKINKCIMSLNNV